MTLFAPSSTFWKSLRYPTPPIITISRSSSRVIPKLPNMELQVHRSPNFRGCDDIALLKEVLALNPFGDATKWSEVRARLAQTSRKEFSARAVRDRAILLFKRFEGEQRTIIRKRATEEEYRELDKLLAEAKVLYNESKRKKAAAKMAHATEVKAVRAAASTSNCKPVEFEFAPAEESFPEDILISQVQAVDTANGSMNDFLANSQQFQSEIRELAFQERKIALEERKVALEETRLKLEEKRLCLDQENFQELRRLYRELLDVEKRYAALTAEVRALRGEVD
ncbi:Hypothetical protein NTJ_07989 [Nesidiocoris tenuis]|uniref:Uncharacterized protein n=1 Tax=Nesidiocoris tenuis TaxID=355587 RepID=A0ABN7AUI0_9HEMI|nr:Hypothetical protein NTJ_07989 [Nesidiocoris tenuis]